MSKFLQLGAGEAFAGFAFGANPQTVYVAGTDPFPLSSAEPPAHLYRTRDGGKTWLDPAPSDPSNGPRYRCLSWSDNTLYACAAGEPGGDLFLVGASSDDGRTWAPAVRLADLSGAKSCVAAQCLQTEEWLCENYCFCAPGVEPSTGSCVDPGDGGAPADAATRDARPDGAAGDACLGTACLEEQGCTCHLGDAPAAPPAAAPLLVVGLLATLSIMGRRRRHARR